VRCLKLSFEINNCYPITIWRRRIMKKSAKLACHVFNSNIAIDSLPTPPNIARNYRVIWKYLWWSRLLPSFQTSGRKYNTVVSSKCMMWKGWRNPKLYRYWETIIDFKWQKQGSLSSFGPFTWWGLHWFVWKPQREQLKGDLSNATIFNPSLFSLVNTFKWKGPRD
jgi:hypothetical protein